MWILFWKVLGSHVIHGIYWDLMSRHGALCRLEGPVQEEDIWIQPRLSASPVTMSPCLIFESWSKMAALGRKPHSSIPISKLYWGLWKYLSVSHCLSCQLLRGKSKIQQHTRWNTRDRTGSGVVGQGDYGRNIKMHLKSNCLNKIKLTVQQHLIIHIQYIGGGVV